MGCCSDTITIVLIAIFDAVISAFHVIIDVCILIAVLFYNGDGNPSELSKGIIAVSSCIAIFIASLQLWIAVRLYSGAKHEDNKKCIVWVGATCIIISIYIIGLLFNRNSGNFEVAILAVISLLIFYKVFGIALVARFAALLRQREQVTRAFISPLVVAHRPQTMDPTADVSVIDLPPPYSNTQNQAADVVSSPPLYCEISVTNSHGHSTNSVGSIIT